MAIVAGDIEIRLSVKTGAAGDSTAGTPAGSLGKYISTTVVDQGTKLNNLFDDVSGVENEASDVEYRCIFVLNDHATLTLQGVSVYISDEVAQGTSIALGVDTTASAAVNSASAQALEVADESTAPSGVTFYTNCISEATSLSLGNIAAQYVKAIWVKRIASNSIAVSNDGATITVVGGTAA